MMTHKNSVPHRVSRALGFLPVLIAGLGIPVASQAQELQEIIVTTRKMEEKLKEVPLSITAFDSKMIETNGITNLADVAALTPGLSFFNPLGENLPVPVIRGIVPQDIFGENAAAVFIDGVYVAGREGLNFSQLDVERIEVVKGPQSAMYGRNAFSGAINYITKKPTNDFEAKTTVETGNRGKQNVQASVSGPVWGDTVFGRVAGLYDDWDGSYDNSIQGGGGNDIGGHRFRSFQGALRWVPSDALEVNSTVYYSNDRIDESAVAGIAANCEDQVETTSAHAANEPFTRYQNFCGRVPNLAALPDALDPSTFPNPTTIPGSVSRDSMPKVTQASGETRHLTRGNLNVSWDVGFGTFDFLSGYSDLQQDDTSDFGRSVGNAIPFLYCPDAQTVLAPANCQVNPSFVRIPMGFIDKENGSTVNEFSQEVRFTSPSDEKLRFAGGAYYFHDKLVNYPGGLIATTQINGQSAVPPGSLDGIGLGAIPGGTQLAIGSYIFGQSVQPDGALDPMNRAEERDRTESWSVFSAVDYDVTEAWQARAEIRYTQETQQDLANRYNNLCTNPLYYQTDPNTGAPVTGNPYGPGNFPYNQPPTADCGNAFWDLRTPTQSWEPVVDANGVPIPGQFKNATDTQTGAARFSHFTGRLSLKYKFENDWIAYGAIAWGQKPGGIQLLAQNVINPTGPSTVERFTNTFDPEKLTAYELGLKGFTSDRRIGVDLGLFYYDWTNIVLRQLNETAPSGKQFEQPVSANVNAGDSNVWGWDATLDFAVTDNLSARLTGAWTDSQFRNARQDTFSLLPSFYTKEPSCAPAAIQAIVGVDAADTTKLQNDKAAQCQQISGNVSGNTQMRQPEWTASLSLDYTHPLRGNWDWYIHNDLAYTGKIFVGNDNESYLPAHTIDNLRLGVKSERYTVEFWVRNLFDNDYPIAAFRDIYWTNTSDITASSAPTHSNFDDFPPLRYSISYPSLRTFGVLARVRFGAAVK